MQNGASRDGQSQSWPAGINATIGMSEEGLVWGAGSVLVRMRKTADGQELALDRDRERLVAMLSVAGYRPSPGSEAFRHIEAASKFWCAGDRALANLRLVFAGLPKVSDPTDAYRMALAEYLLDEGWRPNDLLRELGLLPSTARLEKYSPDQPRVPAGHGRESGEWDFWPAGYRAEGSHQDRFDVAMEGGPPENEKTFEERERLGETTPEEELQHGHPITPTTGVPFTGGRGAALDTTTLEQLSAAARAAADKVGPGKGPVYGTAVHTEFREQINQMGRDDLHSEQSYLNGRRVTYGTPGSIRVDIAEPTADSPQTVYDLKTGSASLTDARRAEFRTHLPQLSDGKEVQIHEVRP